jgi:hypothetical protein
MISIRVVTFGLTDEKFDLEALPGRERVLLLYLFFKHFLGQMIHDLSAAFCSKQRYFSV